jgi:DNA-binding HxlR family transcriptional regulator
MSLRYPQKVEARSVEAGPGGKSGQAGARPVPLAGTPVVCHRYHEAVELVGRRWSGAILYSLIEGPRYFSEVAAAVPGLSDRLLSQRLRELEREGVVERAVHEGSPARVSYCLSESGEALVPALRALYDWAQVWRPDADGRSATG